MLITPNYKWIAKSIHKLEHIRAFAVEFISNPKIQIMVYDVLDYNEDEKDKRKYYMDAVLNKINTLFQKRIELLLKEKSISTKYDYEKYVEICQEKLLQQQRRNQATGNLVTVTINESEEVAERV